MTRRPPTIAKFVRPDLTPIPVLLGAAADGLRALGQVADAVKLEVAADSGRVDVHTLDSVIRSLLRVVSAYHAAGVHDWGDTAERVLRLVRAAEEMSRKGAA